MLEPKDKFFGRVADVCLPCPSELVNLDELELFDSELRWAPVLVDLLPLDEVMSSRWFLTH